MDIIKEQTENHCVIRTLKYGSSLDHMLKLFNVAKNDFPNIESTDVKVVQYGGRFYAGTHGLEFRKPINFPVPDDYESIRELEIKANFYYPV